MKTIEILKIIQHINPTDEPRNSDINGKILKELRKYKVSNTTLNELGENGYIKCIIKCSGQRVTQGIWLTTDGKDEIHRHEGIEKENSTLKEKINRLQEDLTRQNSWTHNPLIVGIITTIVGAIIGGYITYLLTCN